MEVVWDIEREAVAGTGERMRSEPAGQHRLRFLDSLRTIIILLVVTFHAAVTYDDLGGWYLADTARLGALTKRNLTFYIVDLQAFFMGLLFFVSGYVAPSSLGRRGAAAFAKERILRLGGPALFFMLAIQPAMGFFLLGWAPSSSFAAFYKGYIRSLSFLGGSGPLWFAILLLFFSLAYAALSRFLRIRDNGKHRVPGVGGLILLACAIAGSSFLVRILVPAGASIFNLRPGFFPQYVILFATGIAAFRGNWLLPFSAGVGRATLLLGIGVGVPLGAALLLWQGSLDNPGISPVIAGGGTWQSAMFATWESFFCVAIGVGLLVAFRDFDLATRVPDTLCKCSFGIYVFHTPFVVLIGLILYPFEAHPLLKWAMLSVLAFLATWGFVLLLHRARSMVANAAG